MQRRKGRACAALRFSLHLKVDNSQTEILHTALGLRPGD